MEVPQEKAKWMRYDTKLDSILNFIYKFFGSKRQYFHLAPEFPSGKRYWSEWSEGRGDII